MGDLHAEQAGQGTHVGCGWAAGRLGGWAERGLAEYSGGVRYRFPGQRATGLFGPVTLGRRPSPAGMT
ncbi:hypothetical protein [Nonomuraea candida]|uniref:hypothetical protein n=1 Tax=Nonomuraea candida TaxID=359159 RepID=UPI0005B7FD09|nr:hypothetical protein [Nonomuraea candida]